MLGACRLNNKTLRNVRRDQVYQAIIIDLSMLGIISKENCEMLLGSGVPKMLTLPDGTFGNINKEAEEEEEEEEEEEVEVDVEEAEE